MKQPAHLSVDSKEYEDFSDVIDQLKENAVALDVLSGFVHDRIFTEDGIICSVSENDRAPSVQQQFDVISGELHRAEERQSALEWPDADAAVWIAKVRALLHTTLAVHLAVMQQQEMSVLGENAPQISDHAILVDEYASGIAEIERICREHGIESLLPDLWDAAALLKKIKEPEYKITAGTGRKHLRSQLAFSLRRIPRLFTAVLSSLQWERQSGDSVDIMSQAISEYGDNPFAILRAYPKLAGICVRICFDAQDFGQVVSLYEALGPDVKLEPSVIEKYFQSLQQLQDFGKMKAVLENGLNTAAIANDVRRALPRIGWWLHDQHKFREAAIFLLRFAKENCGSPGHNDLTKLCRRIANKVHGRDDCREFVEMVASKLRTY